MEMRRLIANHKIWWSFLPLVIKEQQSVRQCQVEQLQRLTPKMVVLIRIIHTNTLLHQDIMWLMMALRQTARVLLVVLFYLTAQR